MSKASINLSIPARTAILLYHYITLLLAALKVPGSPGNFFIPPNSGHFISMDL